MKGIIVYHFANEANFSLQHKRLKEMIPSADIAKGNPKLWWTRCLKCGDHVACGMRTKKEAVSITRQHTKECQ